MLFPPSIQFRRLLRPRRITIKTTSTMLVSIGWWVLKTELTIGDPRQLLLHKLSLIGSPRLQRKPFRKNRRLGFHSNTVSSGPKVWLTVLYLLPIELQKWPRRLQKEQSIRSSMASARLLTTYPIRMQTSSRSSLLLWI